MSQLHLGAEDEEEERERERERVDGAVFAVFFGTLDGRGFDVLCNNALYSNSA